MSYRRLGRFNKKAPTTVRPPYIIFNPHDLNEEEEYPLLNPPSVSEFFGRPNETFIQIAAIDPGIKNCGIRIERRWSGGTVETVMLARINFLVGDEISDTSYYRNSIRILRPYIPYLEMSQYIIMESQLPINYDMVRMSTHLISFLMMNLENKGCRPMICEVDTYFKSRILKAPPKMTKPELKKWCRDYAIKLLEERGDLSTRDVIISAGKQDDISDCVCYCEGWWKALTEGIQQIKSPLGFTSFENEENKVKLLSVPKPETKKKVKVEELVLPSLPKEKKTRKAKVEEVILPSLPEEPKEKKPRKSKKDKEISFDKI